MNKQELENALEISKKAYDRCKDQGKEEKAERVLRSIEMIKAELNKLN